MATSSGQQSKNFLQTPIKRNFPAFPKEKNQENKENINCNTWEEFLISQEKSASSKQQMPLKIAQNYPGSSEDLVLKQPSPATAPTKPELSKNQKKILHTKMSQEITITKSVISNQDEHFPKLQPAPPKGPVISNNEEGTSNLSKDSEMSEVVCEGSIEIKNNNAELFPKNNIQSIIYPEVSQENSDRLSSGALISDGSGNCSSSSEQQRNAATLTKQSNNNIGNNPQNGTPISFSDKVRGNLNTSYGTQKIIRMKIVPPFRKDHFTNHHLMEEEVDSAFTSILRTFQPKYRDKITISRTNIPQNERRNLQILMVTAPAEAEEDVARAKLTGIKMMGKTVFLRGMSFGASLLGNIQKEHMYTSITYQHC